MQLTGKKILLTGASGGIGHAIARQLDANGASLLLVGRDEGKLNILRSDLTGDHGIVVGDITRPEDRQRVIEQCDQWGLDMFINAAGTLEFKLFQNQSPETVQAMLETNLLSPMLLCQSLIPVLLKADMGVIVNIGSIFGSIGHPGFTSYCASKFGLRGFTEALQRELADTSIKVFYLAPRATRTNLNSNAVNALNEALGNATDSPEQVAQALLKTLRTGTSQHYMGWPEKLFVRLNGLFPGLVHNALVKKLPVIRHHAQSNS